MSNYVNSSPPESNQPQYAELVRFLLTPLLDFPESLRIDCEATKSNQRIWIRVALASKDQGRAFGRGGRNLSAIRTVLTAAGLTKQQSVYLDVYGKPEQTGEGGNKSTSDVGQPKKTIGKEGKKKPQKRSKPTPTLASE